MPLVRLKEAGLAASNSEANRKIGEGAVRVDGNKATDRETRLDRDAGNAEIVAPGEPVTLRHLLARDPLLTVPVHILPLVLADRTCRRRRRAFGKLRATLFASPYRHREHSSQAEW